MIKKGDIFRHLFTLALVAVLAAICFAPLCTLLRERLHRGEVKHETVYDTIPCYYPVPRDSVVIRYVTVKLPVVHETGESVPKAEENVPEKADSVLKGPAFVPDSAEVVLPITQKIYSDSTYTAYVSGFNPSLDSIFVYRQNHFREVTKKVQPRWSIGVQVGYGMQLGPNSVPQLCPYIGVGLTYNILTF